MSSSTIPAGTTTLPSDEELLSLAREAAGHAWAPYSEFPVGAAMVLSDGRVVTGCNVENASSPLGICAERNAAAHAVASGAQTAGDGHLEGLPHIVTVAIVGLKAEPCFPCGACRQVLREFECERVVVSENGAPRAFDFEEILPHSFGPEAL
ncbi:cytidine deaminase [Corynebacterium sp. CMW7794]|uniref:cytidine deaminase n=1 Tax=Corynebacterium TaxID=1716 RepID=UPI0007953BD2|nr:MULTISPECIES: cytidine deaminase [Corynebacterium]KXI18998.1 cytidine deaminase [Corynebacterium sp. CMW7794]MBF9012159.1 cytidine deaminase [Corynebacterium phoceense]